MYQANYQAGFRVVDISDREHPEEIGYFDTTPYEGNPPTMGGAFSAYPYFESGVVIANDQDNGLFVLAPDPSFFAVSGEEAPVTVPDAGFLLTDPAPNPFTNRVTFELAVDATQHIRAEVFDVQGRRVSAQSATGPTVSLSTSGLAPGAYVVRLRADGRVGSVPFFVIR